VVLITHQVQYLRTVRRIYYLQKGEIVVNGTYEELESKGHFLKLQSTETNGAAIANVTEPVSIKQLEFPEEVKEHRSSGRIITYGPKVLGKNSVADNSYKNSSIFLPNFQTISLNYSYYKTTFK
jgi:ABC-type multidrug transport system ATPase subunit